MPASRSIPLTRAAKAPARARVPLTYVAWGDLFSAQRVQAFALATPHAKAAGVRTTLAYIAREVRAFSVGPTGRVVGWEFRQGAPL